MFREILSWQNSFLLKYSLFPLLLHGSLQNPAAGQPVGAAGENI
jgi:hypothetical protein